MKNLREEIDKIIKYNWGVIHKLLKNNSSGYNRSINESIYFNLVDKLFCNMFFDMTEIMSRESFYEI